MSKCGVEGCERKYYARGVCEMHYKRWRLTGTLDAGVKARGSLEERFWTKVEIRGPNECWEWVGGRTGKGYGSLQRAGRNDGQVLAHRLSYEIHKGSVPDGCNVLHSCDNPGCVNPNHLRAGTQSENIIEAFEKKRKVNPVAFGEANPKSKLTLEQVKFIKDHPEMKHTELAELFGLSPNCIRGVRTGRTWKDSP